MMSYNNKLRKLRHLSQQYNATISGGSNLRVNRFLDWLQGGAQVIWTFDGKTKQDKALTKQWSKYLSRNKTCPICLESLLEPQDPPNPNGLELAYCADCYGLKSKPLPRPHVFHKTCLDSWTIGKGQSAKCPVCKATCTHNTRARVRTPQTPQIPRTQEELERLFTNRLAGFLPIRNSDSVPYDIRFLYQSIERNRLNLNFTFRTSMFGVRFRPLEWALGLTIVIPNWTWTSEEQRRLYLYLPHRLAELGARVTQDFLVFHIWDFLPLQPLPNFSPERRIRMVQRREARGLTPELLMRIIDNGKFENQGFGFDLNFEFELQEITYTPLSYVLRYVNDTSMKRRLVRKFIAKGADPSSLNEADSEAYRSLLS